MAKSSKGKKPLKVVELFAGVGGFRVGLDQASEKAPRGFETVWASQWEPGSKAQHAARVYEHVFFRKHGASDADVSKGFSNNDINKVVDDPKLIAMIPDHDVLTGGFPCQDYSVARPLSQAAGLEGKKGVLWWSIYKILTTKLKKGKPVPYLFLENVDRLLKSPATRRGRDFAIMLSTLTHLGYVVEWRVVNAGEYGFPQRRRRTFIVGYHESTSLAKKAMASKNPVAWVTKDGVIATAFPVTPAMDLVGSFGLDKPEEITRNFVPGKIEGNVDASSPFQNSGVMIVGRVHTIKSKPVEPAKKTTLGDILQDEKTVPEEYYISDKDVKRWKAQKEAHKFERTNKDGHTYMYAEGALPFPDHLDKSSRTIITSEGGKTPTRFKHVIAVTGRKGWAKGRKIGGQTYKFRRLTPIELERLCMFSDDHTKYMCSADKTGKEEVPGTKRAFFMGNALVVGAIRQIGEELARRA